jgi:hypothetical protein
MAPPAASSPSLHDQWGKEGEAELSCVQGCLHRFLMIIREPIRWVLPHPFHRAGNGGSSGSQDPRELQVADSVADLFQAALPGTSTGAAQAELPLVWGHICVIIVKDDHLSSHYPWVGLAAVLKTSSPSLVR